MVAGAGNMEVENPKDVFIGKVMARQQAIDSDSAKSLIASDLQSLVTDFRELDAEPQQEAFKAMLERMPAEHMLLQLCMVGSKDLGPLYHKHLSIPLAFLCCSGA